jgi:hypothetical protein
MDENSKVCEVKHVKEAAKDPKKPLDLWLKGVAWRRYHQGNYDSEYAKRPRYNV